LTNPLSEKTKQFFNLVTSGATLSNIIAVFGQSELRQLLLSILDYMTEAEIARKVGRSHRLIAFWTRRFGLFQHRVGFKGAPLLVGSLPGRETLPRIKAMHGRRVRIVSVSPDSELAYFLGFAVGDGSFSDRTISIHQSLKEKDYLPVLESIVAPVADSAVA
jgi:hypothetical protein